MTDRSPPDGPPTIAIDGAPGAAVRRPATRSFGPAGSAGIDRRRPGRSVRYARSTSTTSTSSTRQVAALRAALPPVVELAYASRRTPPSASWPTLAGWASVPMSPPAASSATAIRAGIAADRIVMTGPGKRDDELEAAVAAGVRAVTVESPGSSIASTRSLPRRPVRHRSCCAPPCSERLPASSGSAWSATTAPASSGWMRPTSTGPRARAVESRHLELARPSRLRRIQRARRGRARPGTSRPPPRAARRLAPGGRVRSPARRRGRRARHPVRAARGSRSMLAGSAAGSRGMADLGRRSGHARTPPAARARPLPRRARRRLPGPRRRPEERRRPRVVILDGGIHHLLRPALVGQEHRVRRLGSSAERHRRGSMPGHGGRPAVFRSRRACHGTLLVAPGSSAISLRSSTSAPTASPSRCRSSCPTRSRPRSRSGGVAALIRPRIEPRRWLDDQIAPVWDAAV